MKKRKILKSYKTRLRRIKRRSRKISAYLVRCLCAKKNLERDAIVLGALVFVLVSIAGYNWQIAQKERATELAAKIEAERKKVFEQVSKKVEPEEIPAIDSSEWKEFQSKKVGFSIKYPPDWPDPEEKKALEGEIWSFRYKFRKNGTDDGFLQGLQGFDVAVYSIQKVKELSNTEEYPKINREDLSWREDCAEIDGRLIEDGKYLADEVFISPDDRCFHPAFFFTLAREEYFYNIVPIGGDGSPLQKESLEKSKRSLPEFYASMATFQLIDILIPRKAPAKPKITAPMPVWSIMVNGRRVCAKANDKPSYSNKNKKKHLDMECCLDPDEYPNPNCYYPPNKYGKFLNQ